MRLEEYAELLRWLAGNPSKTDAAAGSTDSSAASAEAAGGSVTILRRLSLDPAAFADLVANFGKRFSTAVGCPESLEREALRRGRRRGAAGGVVFTTIQKFAQTQREGERRRDAMQNKIRSSPRLGALVLNPVSERANVVVTADERNAAGTASSRAARAGRERPEEGG